MLRKKGNDMRQKFGSVALYVIEVDKEKSSVFNTNSYLDSKELVNFQKKHGVSEKMMHTAFEYAKLYSQGAIDLPLEFIDKVSMEEANIAITRAKGDEMSKPRDYNNKDLSVHYSEGVFVIQGEKVKDSKKAREFLKRNGAEYKSDSQNWVLDDIYKDSERLKTDLDKEAMLWGTLSTLHQNEMKFEESKSLYYKAKETGSDGLIEARRYIYNISNIVLSEKISEQSRVKYLDTMMDKSLNYMEEAKNELAELQGKEQTEEVQERIAKVEANIERTEKYIVGDSSRREHLSNLMKDVKVLKDMGYLKEVGKGDTLAISSLEHKKVLASTVNAQNNHEAPKADFIDSFLEKKAEEIKANQEQRQEQSATQEDTQGQEQAQKSTSTRRQRS